MRAVFMRDGRSKIEKMPSSVELAMWLTVAALGPVDRQVRSRLNDCPRHRLNSSVSSVGNLRRFRRSVALTRIWPLAVFPEGVFCGSTRSYLQLIRGRLLLEG